MGMHACLPAELLSASKGLRFIPLSEALGIPSEESETAGQIHGRTRD